MSLDDWVTFRGNLSELPIWRKLVLICALGTSCSLGSIAAFKEVAVYNSAPRVPVATTGQIYRVMVMHGSERFVTPNEAHDLDLWRERASSLVGIFFVIGWLSLTLRRNRAQSVHESTQS